MTARTVLITGAARRIGAAVARHLHAQGFCVAVHCHRSAAEGADLAAGFNEERADSAAVVQADLAQGQAPARVIAAALELNGRLDALVNNAAVFYPTPLPTLNEQDWDETMNANLKAPLFLSLAAAAHLEKTGGCIVNITDVHGARPLRRHTAYSTAKAGLAMLTLSLARELAPRVRVNAVAPGAVTWPPDMDERLKETILARVPLQRPGTPADVARAVHFLISDADYITGQVLAVDGGRSLYG